MKWELRKEEKGEKTEKRVRLHLQIQLNLVYVSVKKIKGLTFKKSKLKKKNQENTKQ